MKKPVKKKIYNLVRVDGGSMERGEMERLRGLSEKALRLHFHKELARHDREHLRFPEGVDPRDRDTLQVDIHKTPICWVVAVTHRYTSLEEPGRTHQVAETWFLDLRK